MEGFCQKEEAAEPSEEVDDNGVVGDEADMQSPAISELNGFIILMLLSLVSLVKSGCGKLDYRYSRTGLLRNERSMG